MTIEPPPQIVSISLDRIIRLSPLNPRQDMGSDVSDLAAMIFARGQQMPIKLRPCPEDQQSYEVLDGGRRWRALRLLAQQGDARDALAVIENGDELAAREIALMISVSPKPLHPVDEYEAFARLEESGAGVEAIAAHFGETVRHVRQRLALGRLSPRVRGLWRAGEIDREQAEAFTAGPIEAQDALLDEFACRSGQALLIDSWEIRRELRGETLSNKGPEGKFLLADKSRVDAYIAAGGRIDDNLFEEEIIIRDPAIARKIVDDALRAEAERIMADEGWGAALIESDGADPFDAPDDLDLSLEEESRIEEIANDERVPDIDLARLRALDDERRAIERDAILRMFSPAARAAHAVGVFLDRWGRSYISRALPLPETAGGEYGGDDDHGADGAPDNSIPHPDDEHVQACVQNDEGGETGANTETIPDPLAEPGKALRAIIDEAATKALCDISRRRGDIALMLAVAALGCCYGAEVVRLTARGYGSGDEGDDGLLARIADEPFDVALAICAAAPTADLSVALFRLIAGSVDTRGAGFETIGTVCAAVCARGGDLVGAFDEALDRRAFFEAAPKPVTLGCVTGLIGPAEAARVRKMKKTELGDYVARLSKDKGHLPAPLADWAAAKALPDAGADAILVGEAPSLAQAMSAAIAADATGGAPPAKTVRGQSKGQQDRK